MKVVKEYPPNYVQLKQFFPLDLENYPPLFPYGEILYAPHHKEEDIPEDIMFHEEIHAKQQAGNPEMWWSKYCTNAKFRLEQELQAYAAQWHWIRRNWGAEAGEHGLEEMADNLSSPLYQLSLSHNEALSKIRQRGKRMLEVARK